MFHTGEWNFQEKRSSCPKLGNCIFRRFALVLVLLVFFEPERQKIYDLEARYFSLKLVNFVRLYCYE